MKKRLLILLGLMLFGGCATTPVVDNSEVHVTNPAENSTVSFPLTVNGEAMGSWFFEAQLRVELQNDAGDVLATAPGMAQEDWMQEGFVDFTAEIESADLAGATEGKLVIKNDNPSGMPENDRSFELPVQF